MAREGLAVIRRWIACVGLVVITLFAGTAGTECGPAAGTPEMVELPDPPKAGGISVEDALASRRSVRQYTDEQLTLEMISGLLWAAQGETAGWGGRTAPSAGALFPMEIRVVAGGVLGLKPGVYRYRNDAHALVPVLSGDQREAVAEAALGQACLRQAPAVLVVSAIYRRTMKKYRDRGIRYAHIETGAVCQNIYLQAESLGLGTVLIGAFYDDEISQVLALGKEETPLALMPVGHPLR
jgi:SagB-type dehydrogenase family enzyme